MNIRAVLRCLACVAVLLLAACGGGGDSSTTTVSGAGLSSLGLSPAVATPFVQTANNLRVVVQDGPHGFQLGANANVLYATVTVCVPGGNPANPTECQTIDHIQVDTGSVGLRVLASKVRGLNLPRVSPSGADTAWECFPFVIGGLWGQNAVADVGLGQQTATRVPVQLIEDNASSPMQPTADCIKAADGNVLGSATALGSNGILGIGSTTLDCGQNCVTGNYISCQIVNGVNTCTGFVQYYSCPQGAANSGACSATAVPINMQVYNPIAALPTAYNNGVVLKMPAVIDPGAATASGELIFGLDTVQGQTGLSDNHLPPQATKVVLGTDWQNQPDSYLNVTTRYGSTTYRSSYLDTGTNGLFFTDTTLTPCTGSTWYCPRSTLNPSAVISDGDNPALNPVTVNFQIGNAEALFSTNNTAFQDAAGTTPGAATSFAWGMPFFYGRQVYLSIWQQVGALTAPWYAWVPL